MVKISWSNIDSIIDHKLKSIDTKTLKCVYGVPRGGIPVAIMVAQKLKLPLIENIETIKEKFSVLVVDDLIDSGATRKRFGDYRFLTVYDKQGENKNQWVEFPWERMNGESPAEDAVTRMLEYIGEDPTRDGLKETPTRVLKAWDHIFSGYKIDPCDLIKEFECDGYDQMILLKNIEIYSMCEHHLLPFIGRAHVAYIPDKKVIGVSKLARITDVFARRVQIQERIGEQVTDFLMNNLNAKGAACVIEAQHLCMQMRGVEKQHSVMVTSSLKGVFKSDVSCRQEFLGLIK